MSPRPLTELVSPDWAEALQPVAATITAMGAFLRAELAAGRSYLPAGEHVLRAFSRPLSQVKVLIVGQDPYPTPGHPVGLSFSVASARTPDPTLTAEHLRRAPGRSRHPSGRQRRSHPVVRARCPAAQSSADRAAWSLRIPPRQRLGAGDTAGNRGSGRSGWPARGDLVGARRAVAHTHAWLSPLLGERPPVTVVRCSWVLRVATFQPRQRLLVGRRRAGRLGARAAARADFAPSVWTARARHARSGTMRAGVPRVARGRARKRGLCPDRRSDPRRPRCPR